MSPTPQGATAPGRGLPRRGFLVAGTLAAALSGCALNNPFSDSDAPDEPTPERAVSPDVAIAVEAVGHLEAASAVVRATVARHPALRTRLEGFAAAHQAHLEALRAAVPERVTASPAPTTPTPVPYVVPTKRSAALAGVQTEETMLHDTLIALALRAESGPFARLLGTMTAAISQQLAVLAR